MTTDYRLVTFTHPTSALFPATAGAVGINTVDFASSVPELADYMDGWEAIGFQVIPSGDLTYISLMLRTALGVPDTTDGI